MDSPGIRQFKTATNGLLSCYAAIPLVGLSEEDIEVIQTAVGVVGRLGFADKDYQETARLLDACGGVSARVEFASDADDTKAVRGYLVASIIAWIPAPRMASCYQRCYANNASMKPRDSKNCSSPPLVSSMILYYPPATALPPVPPAQLPGNAGLQFRLTGLGREQLKLARSLRN